MVFGGHPLRPVASPQAVPDVIVEATVFARAVRPQMAISSVTTTRKRLWSPTVRTEKRQKMWCKCGALSPWTRHEGPFLAPHKPVTWDFSGADDGIRTRDPNLGKVVLYQLSHVRVRRTL